jgi:hypothetical protein
VLPEHLGNIMCNGKFFEHAHRHVYNATQTKTVFYGREMKSEAVPPCNRLPNFTHDTQVNVTLFDRMLLCQLCRSSGDASMKY